MELQIRVATSVDVPAMARCRATDPDAGAADERMEAYLERRHHPQQALPPRIAFVAMAGYGVIGYIAGHLTTRFECSGEVQYLFVAPAFRRRGVASGLLRRLAGWFREQGAARVCVDVNADSPAAAPFYFKSGAAPLNPHWYVWSDITHGLE